MTNNGIMVSSEDGITLITLSRSPVNALDRAMIDLLAEIFGNAKTGDPVLLTGAGDAFSAGIDVKAYAAYSSAERKQLALAITRMTGAALSLRAPFIAAVNGHAMGGGFVLMLCADYRIVTSANASFALSEARAGIPFPAGPAEIVRRELPASMARQLTLTGKIVAAPELLKAGVFDEMAAPPDLVQRSLFVAKRLAEQPAFASVKRQIRGPLIDAVNAHVITGADPFLSAFS